MRSRDVLLRISPPAALLGLLVGSLLGTHALAVCPSMCSCSRSHREVDCSWRGLRQLPDGLQHNMRSLNLSHNRFQHLDHRLTVYTHLRVLDLSHNRLSHLPAGLPRSLWQLHAASNHLRLLDKNDTAYQWNLRLLDLSHNKLERATFINNTLISLCTLNLSHNHFWTLPTNMPMHLEAIDLSHNLLVKVLPGSLDRLPRLTHLYLHANRFATLPLGVLDRMTSLRVIALGSNPWACHLYGNITYVLSWTQHTPARVLGCPCHTESVCGGAQPSRTGGWHFASYNPPPLVAGAQDASSLPPGAGGTGWRYLSVPAPPNTQMEHRPFTDTPVSVRDHTLHTHPHLFPGTDEDSPPDSLTSPFSDTSFASETPIGPDMTLPTGHSFTTESPFAKTKKTTTLRTRSVRRPSQSHPRGGSSRGPGASSLPLLHNLGLLLLILRHGL